MPITIVHNAFSLSELQSDIKLSSLSLSISQTSSQPNTSSTIQCISHPCEEPPYDPSDKSPSTYSVNNNITNPKENVNKTMDEINNVNELPCISPCPPGEICIQMCKPIGRQDILSSEIPPLDETGLKEDELTNSHISTNSKENSLTSDSTSYSTETQVEDTSQSKEGENKEENEPKKGDTPSPSTDT